MALAKAKKQEVVEQVTNYLISAKIVVLAKHNAVSVKAMQELRRDAKASGTSIRIIKNNLFIRALDASEKYAGFDRSIIEGQLMFGFNAEDEIAPAQILSKFAKTGQEVQFVGAIDSDGSFVSAQDVKAMADLPSNEQLRSQLVGVLSAPLTSFASVTSGNLGGFINILNSRSKTI